MIPDQDYYADKNGKLTDNPDEFAVQIGVKGCFLDERVARRYGIGNDVLASVAEPNAPSIRVVKIEEKAAEKPQEPAKDKIEKAEVEQAETKPETPAKKAAANKEKK